MIEGTLKNCPDCRNIDCTCPKGIGKKLTIPQTNNIIREEWREKVAQHSPHGLKLTQWEIDFIENYWLSKIDELLKSQREEKAGLILNDVKDLSSNSNEIGKIEQIIMHHLIKE